VALTKSAASALAADYRRNGWAQKAIRDIWDRKNANL